MHLKKEFRFVLPDPLDDTGQQIKGVMRLIKVKDLMDVQRDSRVQDNSLYFYVVLLSRVIVQLDTYKMMNTKIIENLSTKNFAFLMDFLNTINHAILKRFPIKCSSCETVYQGEMKLVGEL